MPLFATLCHAWSCHLNLRLTGSLCSLLSALLPLPSVVLEVVAHLGKDEQEVGRYFDTWMIRHGETNEDERAMARIIKGEEKIQRRKDITSALDWKVSQYKMPWQELRLPIGSAKGKSFTEDEDRFLTCMMHKLGYGRWEELKLEIRKAWQFRFDWYIKSRTPLELQRRCDIIVKSIEQEKDPAKRAALLEKKNNRSKALRAAKKAKAEAAKANADVDGEDEDEEDEEDEDEDEESEEESDDDEEEEDDDEEESEEDEDDEDEDVEMTDTKGKGKRGATGKAKGRPAKKKGRKN